MSKKVAKKITNLAFEKFNKFTTNPYCKKVAHKGNVFLLFLGILKLRITHKRKKRAKKMKSN